MEDKFNTGETRYLDADGNEITKEEHTALYNKEEIENADYKDSGSD